MAYTISLTNHKGGVGKTTTAIAIGCEWAMRGLSVLFVDTDPQRHLVGFAQVGTGLGFGHEVPTVRAMSGEGLRRQLRDAAAGYDLVIVDSPPRYQEIQEAVISCADLILVPTGVTQTEVWALRDAATLAQAEMRRRDCAAVALLTRHDTRTVQGRHAAATVAEAGLGLLETRLGNRVDYTYAPAAGRGVTAYAPRSEAATEVRRLCDELEVFAEGGIPIRLGAVEVSA